MDNISYSFYKATKKWQHNSSFTSKASEQNHSRNPIFIQIITNIMQWWVHQSTHKYTNLLLSNVFFFSILLCMNFNRRKSPPALTLILLMLNTHTLIFPVSFFFLTIYPVKGHFMCITSVSTTSEWWTCKQNSCTWEAFVSNFRPP